jgi:hypothetical protein
MSPHTLPLAAILLSLTLSAANAQTVTRIPKAFQGVWAADLERCASTGEHEPYTIDSRHIIAYEHGWTIRRLTLRKGVWIGRGTSGDDQGETPATVTLQMGRDGKLKFNDFDYIRCPEKPRAE